MKPQPPPIDSADLADPSLGLADISRRRAWAWLGYGGLGLAATAAGLWGWQQKNAPSANNFSHHPLNGSHLQALDGGRFDTASFLQGQVAVLNFWAPWCPPCVAELPLIDAQYGAIADKTFQLLAIALDDLDAVQRFWRARSLPHIQPVVAGYAGMQLMQALGNSSGQLPFTLLLGADGAILHSHLGELKTPDIASIFALAEQAAK